MTDIKDTLGRAMPNARVRRFFLGVQEVMSASGLNTILRQIGLPQYVGALPPDNAQTNLRAANYAAILQAIETYYGRGGRSTLTRIGYMAFEALLPRRPLTASLYRLRMVMVGAHRKQRLALDWLARELAAAHGQVAVELRGRHWWLLDYTSDATVGRTREYPICWTTVGEIQAAMQWATGQEYEVTEHHCKALGAPACEFEIGSPISQKT